jgi:hypothetical protein
LETGRSMSGYADTLLGVNVLAITIAGCLIACIAGIVAVTITQGADSLVGTGLGGLTALLAGALVAAINRGGSGKS